MSPRWVLVALALVVVGATPVSAQVAMHTVSVTTDGSGDVTAYAPTTFGHVSAIRYVPDASTPLETGADITITDTVTGLQILAVTNVGPSARDFWPRAFTMTTTGTVALYAAGGTNVLDLVPIANPIKVVVAQGGATKSGTLYIYVTGR